MRFDKIRPKAFQSRCRTKCGERAPLSSTRMDLAWRVTLCDITDITGLHHPSPTLDFSSQDCARMEFGLRTVPPERHLYLISWSSRPYKMQCEQSNKATAEWEPDPFKAYAVDFYEQVAHSIKLMYVYLYTLYLLRCNVCNICIFV